MSIINIDKLCVGSALFIGGYTPTSWLIRKYLGFRYSHVAMYMGDGKIIEADVGGVQINPIHNYLNRYVYYGEVLVPPLAEDALSHAVVMTMKELKDKYDYQLMIGNLLRRLFHQSRKKLGLYDVRNAWLCSELLAYGYTQAGLSLGSLTPSQITPKNLYRIFKERQEELQHGRT